MSISSLKGQKMSSIHNPLITWFCCVMLLADLPASLLAMLDAFVLASFNEFSSLLIFSRNSDFSFSIFWTFVLYSSREEFSFWRLEICLERKLHVNFRKIYRERITKADFSDHWYTCSGIVHIVHVQTVIRYKYFKVKIDCPYHNPMQ